jgi:hypothetical protein
VAIRTPDQRLRVFVSSTLCELAAERHAVSRAITALRLTPVMFELGARPHPPQELYRAYLEQSDVFIGLYWQRYGWIGPGMQVSGLEDEFNLARRLPQLLYIKTPAPDREPHLTSLLDRIRAEGAVSYRAFGTPAELARLVRDDLAMLLSERFADRAQSPPASVQEPRPLPASTTSLVGREHDVDEVVSLLERPEVRLVTLTRAGRDRQDPARSGRGPAAAGPLPWPHRLRAAGLGVRPGAAAGQHRPGGRQRPHRHQVAGRGAGRAAG